MDVVELTATRIAKRVAPDEVDVAPELLRAALAGERLPSRSGSAVLGGFGPTDLWSLLQAVCVAISDHRSTI
ncbi:hypothetical protein, partial [Bacillus amyloliquefaciens]|uniref:hypothetical protein n=1 Tax=Bacillus amyloliquefaciens TaxID=1390 RepID=UPI00197AEBAE